MKVNYQFANGEKNEIEVEENWGELLLELDRQEHNNNQTEKRRHASLDAFNLDGTLFPSGDDIEAECIRNEEWKALYDAIEQLLPQQQELIKKVFIEMQTLVSIARAEGVGESAIRDRLNRIYKKIKQNFK